MGGIISMIFAGGYPERVERLVLNDIGPEIDPAGLKRITDYFTDAPTEFRDMDEVAAYYRANYPFLTQRARSRIDRVCALGRQTWPEGGLTWKIDPAVRNIPRTGAAARPMDMWVPYARIQAKMLVIRGAESDILAAATAERMSTVVPGTQAVEVPGVGHAPTLNEPAATDGHQAILQRLKHHSCGTAPLRVGSMRAASDRIPDQPLVSLRDPARATARFPQTPRRSHKGCVSRSVAHSRSQKSSPSARAPVSSETARGHENCRSDSHAHAPSPSSARSHQGLVLLPLDTRVDSATNPSVA